MTESSLSTTATTRTTPATENSSTWRGRAGPSKNVSDPPRMRLDSTTTRSAPGTPGTDISPSPYSPTPSWPSWHTQPKKRGRQRTGQPHQQEDRTDQPAEPETTGLAIHRRLVALTLAEIRRLLNLIHHGEHAVARGLEWSTWRRWHQAQARRAHVRRHLHLQTLMI